MTIGILPPRWSGPLLSTLRIVAALLFMLHGTMKLFGWPALEPTPPVPLGSIVGIAGMLEFGGGALLLIGLLTRPVAFLLSGQMAVAYFSVHFAKSPFPSLSGGEPAVLFCFVFLFIAAAGPGPWAVDRPHAASRVHTRMT